MTKRELEAKQEEFATMFVTLIENLIEKSLAHKQDPRSVRKEVSLATARCALRDFVFEVNFKQFNELIDLLRREQSL